MLVLWRTVIDPLYPSYTTFEQNILKWAALLHDIRKLGSPVFEGKDHIHPFKSSQTVIQIFRKLGILNPNKQEAEDFKHVDRLIDESVQPIWKEWRNTFKHGVPVCTQMHSHNNLPEIFYYLWHKGIMKRGSFHDLVFRLVMYHQSLDGCSEWPHIFTFTASERDQFCDQTLFRLIKLLMIADSSSYNFLSDLEFQNRTRNDFIANNDRMSNEWI